MNDRNHPPVKLRRTSGRTSIFLLALVLGTLVFLVFALLRIERATRIDISRFHFQACALYCDRYGRPLRFVPDKNDHRHLWVASQCIPEHVRQAFIAAEDQRFYSHQGVDYKAIIRAMKDNLANGRIVSGASTITEQLIRLSYHRPRTYRTKFIEALQALRLESKLAKENLLTLYLNRVPQGNNLYGIEAASRIYFGKSSKDLTISEAAVLAALPKAPERFNPYGTHRNRLLHRKDWVLDRMRRLGYLSGRAYRVEKQRPVSFRNKRFPFEAPHLLNILEAKRSPGGKDTTIYTTIDLDLQHRVENVLGAHAERLLQRGASQAAAVVLDNRTLSVLAYVGAISYSPRNKGYNNGVTAFRSPGSALKPFLYAQALDAGFTAATILEDIPKSYLYKQGIYQPVNYDRHSYGPVTLRDALANSLNLAAVHLLSRIGYEHFYTLLKRLHLGRKTDRGADHYGLGMVVGNLEVNLLQLATAYACLANGGLYRPARLVEGQRIGKPIRVFSSEAAFIINRILSAPLARTITFALCPGMKYPFKVAVKTGTSSKYRDCWALGYTPEHTIAIWVGNFDGLPTAKLSGASGAAPILADILRDLYRLGPPSNFPVPAGVVRKAVCSFSGMKPRKTCPHVKYEWFIKGTEPQVSCTYHLHTVRYLELPVCFADWLYQRYLLADEGRFRLSGFNLDLAKTFPSISPEGFSPQPERSSIPVVIGRNLQVAHHHLEKPSSTAFSRQAVTIVSPLNGGHYTIGDIHEKDAIITFKAASSNPVPKITWFVDGYEVGTSGPPYELQWQPTRGHHTIVASTPERLADEVEIMVE